MSKEKRLIALNNKYNCDFIKYLFKKKENELLKKQLREKDLEIGMLNSDLSKARHDYKEYVKKIKLTLQKETPQKYTLLKYKEINKDLNKVIQEKIPEYKKQILKLEKDIAFYIRKLNEKI